MSKHIGFINLFNYYIIYQIQIQIQSNDKSLI
jgi:hypothetical protein